MDPALVDYYPKTPAGDTWLPDLACGMTSAYAAAHSGSEPDFTNYAQCAKDDAPFIGCLDYIFTSPHFRVVDAPALPHRDGVLGPFPTATEPSDHLLLSAELELPLRSDSALAEVYGAAAGVGEGGSKRRRVERGGRGFQSREADNEAIRKAKHEELLAFVARPDLFFYFPASINSFERRLVHEIADGLDLLHTSHGEGYDRFIRVEKKAQV
jgi:hypothetical protein